MRAVEQIRTSLGFDTGVREIGLHASRQENLPYLPSTGEIISGVNP